MKKVIFIVSVLFFLAGCRKEKIEPVEIPTKINEDTLFLLPSRAELTNGKMLFAFNYSYYPNGLIKTIERYSKFSFTPIVIRTGIGLQLNSGNLILLSKIAFERSVSNEVISTASYHAEQAIMQVLRLVFRTNG